MLLAPLFGQTEPVWPLSCKPQLTSTFGEFRVGHFHAGIDLRTPDGEGMPIFAPADGSVVRVRETPWGYGKVIYYKTTDGLTAVFAHLSGFAEIIEEKVNAEKYKNRDNTAEIWLKEGKMPFGRGDTLGYSGSTGAGSAHLHFEMRAEMDKPINPMFLGYFTEDNLSPTIRDVWMIPRSDDSHIRGRKSPYKLDTACNGGETEIDDVILAHGLIALAISISDRESDENLNSYGPYIIRAIVDSETTYTFKCDTFAYSHTGEIGLVYEHGLQEEFSLRRPPFRLERPAVSTLTMLKAPGSGLIDVSSDTVNVRIEVEDFIGNSTVILFRLASEIIMPVNLEFDSVGSVLHSSLEVSDTVGLKAIYYRDEEKFRIAVPTSEIPIKVKKGWQAVEIASRVSGATVAIWRPETECSISFSHRFFGAEAIVIGADFSAPPPSLPLLKREKYSIRPDKRVDTSFAFRVFDPEPGENFILAVGEQLYEFQPPTWRFENNSEYDISGGWRIEIPKRGVFQPFIASDSLFPADSLWPERIRIDPPGVVLDNSATIFHDTTGFGLEEGKLCIIRLWGGDSFFVSNTLDKKGRLNGKIGALGTFALAADTIPPKFNFVTFDSSNVTGVLSAGISDNLSGFSREGLPNSFIDGVWIPTEYDSECASLTVDVDGFEAGLHWWKIEYADVCGNASVDSIRFVRKEVGK